MPASSVVEAWALLGIPNPLPLIDGLLAATAKVHGPTFATRNVADIVVTGVPLLDPFSGPRNEPSQRREGHALFSGYRTGFKIIRRLLRTITGLLIRVAPETTRAHGLASRHDGTKI